MRADYLPHARVSVLVNGVALTEFSTESGDGQGATTFIEAVPGATFSVEVELEPAFATRRLKDQIVSSIRLDGETVSGSVIYADNLPAKSIVSGVSERKNGEATLRAFVFAEHATADGQAHTSLMQKLANMGEIEVQLLRCRVKGILQGDQKSVFKGIGDDPIPEKATKGRSVSSHVKLGQQVKVPKPRFMDVSYPYGLTPIATYKFQYRSRRDLEIEGILERPPSPAPPVKLEGRDPNSLTLEEAREQLRLLRARDAASNIKQESQRENRKRERSETLAQENGNEENDNDGDDEVTITAEWDRRKRVRASAEGAEVVDLTEDD